MKTPIFVLGATLVLAGCVTTETNYDNRVTAVSGDAALVQYDGPAFAGGSQTNLRYADLWQVEEIATFEKDGAVLKAWFTAAHRDQTIAMQFPYTISNFAKLWQELPDDISFDEELHWVKNTGRVFLVRDFTLERGSTQQQCFTFGAEYDGPSGDPLARPGAGIYGYYCAANAEAFSEKDRLKILTGLWAPNREPEKPDWRTAGNPQALAKAQSQLAEFPFTLGHFFPQTDGDQDR